VGSVGASIAGVGGAADRRVLCDHCGLPVPKGLIAEAETHQFCCNGCSTVFSILNSTGLEGYYGVRDAIDAPAQQPVTTGGAYDEFDDERFAQTWVRDRDDGTKETELLVEGMHCAACVWLIERLPRVAPGVIEARANIRSRTVSLRYDPEATPLSRVARALDRLGYAPHPARGGAARAARAHEDRRFLIRVGVAGALAGNIMLLSIALYGGAFSGIDEVWRTTFRWYAMGLGVVSLAWPGRVFFRGALGALRTRTAHLDIPIALALLVGGAWGVVNTVRGTGEIYFDSISVLVFLLLVGRWIQHRQQRAAADSIELMLTLTPTSATMVAPDGSTARVPIERVEPGMLLRVEAGGSIPADGVVSEGETALDNALLTGESEPAHAAAGDPVCAGATNLRAPITMRVDAVGSSTRVGKLMDLVARASEDKAEIVRFTDRVAGVFVLVVIALAAITGAAGAAVSGLEPAIEHATALLIVTCPCALGLATPMAMSVALGRAAAAGMLAKSASALEALAKPGTMILDKTGTLTMGRTSVASAWGDGGLIRDAGVLERASNHPIAAAIAAMVEDDGGACAESVAQTTGAGIEGVVGGKALRVGTRAYVEAVHDLDDDALDEIASVLDRALTPIVVASDDGRRAVLGVGDEIRPDARGVLDELRERGWRLILCSGDHERVVAGAAAALGIDDARGGVSPEGKADLVRTLKDGADGGPVVMVGDGVNDAAALASADVGIAVHGGAEASLSAADLYLVREGVAPIARLTRLARSTMGTIRACLVFSLSYNAVTGALAMMGFIDALAAAVLMPISSLTVVAICTRAGRGAAERGGR